MAVSYRRVQPNVGRRPDRAGSRARRAPAPAPAPGALPVWPRRTTPAKSEREVRCEVLSRRFVLFGVLSAVVFLAGFFLTVFHAALLISVPLGLAFRTRHKLDLLKEELQREAADRKKNRSDLVPARAEPERRAA